KHLYEAHGFVEGAFHQPARRLDCRRAWDALSDDRCGHHLERGEVDRPYVVIRPQFLRYHPWVGQRGKWGHFAFATEPLIPHSLQKPSAFRNLSFQSLKRE